MGQYARKPSSIREHNVRLLLSCYLQGEPCSPSRLAPYLRISRTSANTINEILLDQGLIEPIGKGISTISGGKRPALFQLQSRFGYFLCIHVKYDKIEAKVLDFRLSTISSAVIDIGANPPLNQVCEAISQLHQVLCKAQDLSLLGIAVAVHALIDLKTGVCLHATHFPSWGTNVDLRRAIKESLGESIILDVDSWMQFKTLELSRETDFKNVGRFIVIHVGSFGVVAGLWEHGHTGRMAPEVGHMIVYPEDQCLCQCGGRGCLESVLDYGRIIKKAKSLHDVYPSSVIFASEEISIATITEGFIQGDQLCYHLLVEVAHWIAIALSNINMLFFPELIILEGDFLKAGHDWEVVLQQQIDSMCMTRLRNKLKLIFHQEDTTQVFIGEARSLRSLFLDRYKP